ncbi:DNA polymerase III subunit gamma/tau [Endozoicomonas montiporae]|uniref:DNA polymerase III subunit gamma/tau n=2 Tax=Endozoicomonas montiporae TaxID=1027273 RepID=A0A081NC46_9GAMM|nr:DNA polymerase III subunit gamma/tau [Endozoicomonas montiporae]AMO56345.1 DNA polymerase III subunits gamma and tau [Endozoicomonas montiporae CL-33]KEQ16019.1 DNA polymerase III subunit gamma/tau [Endozoicomonas montiporae]
MSYQVLARKWRPRSFKELVGQTHVLQALVNALDQDRLHHAYLFTGTRGVGKTTIARILAKCLNCEEGVSSTPCGQCAACHEIDDGRFVDLIEVDAASRTKVEDTRELLDNVQYAPTRGRYKVYLIDEVHMLSAHSFNALLKTLEEPPPHVKFLLATTDPQKLPITILSRCLQFGLKNMTPERIVGHLENVLGSEHIPYETSALWQLARAADGSMRDSLSLTDQAIAFGNGRVSEAEVSSMLGTIDQGQVMKMVRALSTADAGSILKAVAELSEHSPDYMAVLNDMLSVLHRIAIAQAVPDAVDNSQGDREQVLQLAGGMRAEDVQLYYQIGLVGKRDLPLAPEPRSGFEMALLRMLAFRPEPVRIEAAMSGSGGSGVDASAVMAEQTEAAEPEPEPLVNEAESAAVDVVESYEALTAEVEGPIQPPESVQQAQSPAVNPLPDDFSPSPAPESEPIGSANALPLSSETVPVVEAQLEPVASSLVNVEIEPEPEPEPEVEPLQDESPFVYEQAGDPGFQAEYVPAGAVDVEPADREDDDVPPPLSTYESYAASMDLQNLPVPGSTVTVPVADESPVLPDPSERVCLTDLDARSWIPVYRSLPLGGVTRTIGSHCEYVAHSSGRINLRLDEQRSTLYNDTHRERIEAALSEYFQQPVRLQVEVGVVQTETPAAWRERKIAERLQQARDSIYSDANVQSLVDQFTAVVLDDSIQPVGNVIK